MQSPTAVCAVGGGRGGGRGTGGHGVCLRPAYHRGRGRALYSSLEPVGFPSGVFVGEALPTGHGAFVNVVEAWPPGVVGRTRSCPGRNGDLPLRRRNRVAARVCEKLSC
eukprot:scaffold34658_cov107-Isochrysis_galbana.AAC.1